MTKRVKYTAICKGWKLINPHLRIEIGFQRLRVFVCNCSTIVTPTKALFHVISPLGNLVIAYRTNLVVIVQKPLEHFMINIQYTLKFSQCLQGLLERKAVEVSGLLLSVSWWWWWWWRMVEEEENNRILWPENLYKCATF